MVSFYCLRVMREELTEGDSSFAYYLAVEARGGLESGGAADVYFGA